MLQVEKWKTAKVLFRFWDITPLVSDTGSQRLEIGHHPRETPAGTDAFLLAHVFQKDTILAIEFTPGALYHHIKG